MTDRAVPIRDVHLEDDFIGVPKYFADDNIVMSHLFAVLSATFPDGENYFVRAVERVQNRITDPRLSDDIKGFIGQESTHGREHRAFNARLSEYGYPTRAIERYTDRANRAVETVSNVRLHLAVTAALEHYTATLAEILLTDPDAREVFRHEGARRLFVWHSLEESEHKAVAFDTFRQVGGTERMRLAVMTAVHIDFFLEVLVMTLISLTLDPVARREPLRTIRGIGRLFRSPFVSVRAVRQLLEYNRRGFHPNDRDTPELVRSWRQELFGASDATAFVQTDD